MPCAIVGESKLELRSCDLSISHVMTTSPTFGSPIACLRLAITLGCELQTLQNDAMPESDPGSVVPAQLSFLAIYNPTLGPTDETLEDQIVFYTSRSNRLQDIDESTTEEEVGKTMCHEKNERLRQIGLAQGMVSFARWASHPRAHGTRLIGFILQQLLGRESTGLCRDRSNASCAH